MGSRKGQPYAGDAVLCMLSTLAQVAATRMLSSVWLLTFGAQPLASVPRAGVEHEQAGLWGMARSARSEAPAANISCFDFCHRGTTALPQSFMLSMTLARAAQHGQVADVEAVQHFESGPCIDPRGTSSSDGTYGDGRYRRPGASHCALARSGWCTLLAAGLALGCAAGSGWHAVRRGACNAAGDWSSPAA
eukprot:305577-Prymnesium_polylepis.1